MRLDGYQKREFLTITELDSAARCARKYFYQCGCGLRPGSMESGQSAMHFGTCIHKAIGGYFNSFDLDEAMSAFTSEWKDTPGDEKRNVETARMMMFSFASKHPKGGGLYTPLKPPETGVKIEKEDRISNWEIPFAIDVGVVGTDGRSIPLVGRIDGWCRSNTTSDIWLNEFKTSSEMSTRFLNGFKRSPQVLGYTLAARTQGWADIRGVYIEALKVAKTSWATEIVPVEVSDFELEDFIKWVRMIGAKILWCEDNDDWPKEPSGCTTYPMFGQPGYTCDFDGMCSVPDWTTMRQFYNVERHVPFVMAKEDGVK